MKWEHHLGPSARKGPFTKGCRKSFQNSESRHGVWGCKKVPSLWTHWGGGGKDSFIRRGLKSWKTNGKGGKKCETWGKARDNQKVRKNIGYRWYSEASTIKGGDNMGKGASKNYFASHTIAGWDNFYDSTRGKQPSGGETCW